MKTRKLFLVAAVALGAVVTGFGQKPTVNLSTLTDRVTAGEVGNLLADHTVLYEHTIYILDEKVYVPNGKSLSIQPGTIIKGAAGQGADTKVLVVSRGGKIFANGTAEKPIVFTTIEDPIEDVTLGSSYSVLNKEKWGGLVILGRAYNSIEVDESNPESPGIVIGERNGLGYMEGLPQPDPRHWYGAESWTDPQNTPNEYSDDIPVFDDNDNSGVIRYVSVRHGGTEISTNNEINGITLGSVGRGTVFEHIEVVSNGDDGIEFFGGTVDIKYAIVMFCDDDYIDWDQGYSGRGQFILGVHLQETTGSVVRTGGDHGMEMDGDDGPRSLPGARLSDPRFYNVTILGDNSSGDKGLELKERTKGTIANSIFANFLIALDIEQDNEKNSAPGVPYPAVGDDGLKLYNNLFLNCGPYPVQGAGFGLTPAQEAQLVTDKNEFITSTDIIDDKFTLNVVGTGITQVTNVVNAYDVVPAAGIAVINDVHPTPVDNFFEYAPYRGAFAPGAKAWNDGWSKLEDVRIDNATVDCPTDTNGDGVTNASDYNNVAGAYGKSCGN